MSPRAERASRRISPRAERHGEGGESVTTDLAEDGEDQRERREHPRRISPRTERHVERGESVTTDLAEDGEDQRERRERHDGSRRGRRDTERAERASRRISPRAERHREGGESVTTALAEDGEDQRGRREASRRIALGICRRSTSRYQPARPHDHRSWRAARIPSGHASHNSETTSVTLC